MIPGIMPYGYGGYPTLPSYAPTPYVSSSMCPTNVTNSINIPTFEPELLKQDAVVNESNPNNSHNLVRESATFISLSYC